MAFTVTRARTERMSFKASGNNNAGIQVTWHNDYYVDVSGGDIATHTVLDVLTATGIPKVNYTIWSNAVGTKIMPWVVCVDKTAERHPQNLNRWTVKTKFESPQGRSGGQGTTSSQETDNEPIDTPADITDISPTQTISIGEMERVLYYEKGDVVPRLQTNLTPTGNWWSSPVMEKLPLVELKHSQYEDSITYDQMVERKFKINQGDWNGESQDMWLVKDIEASPVEVTLQSGTAEKALVTYTLALHPDHQLEQANNRVYGWMEVRALIDTQYWSHPVGDPNRKLKPFASEVPGKSQAGYIDIQGLKRADQTGEPDYIAYSVFEQMDFSTFLRL